MKEFLYYLTEEDGRSLYVINNIVSSTGMHRPLDGGHSGWSEIEVAWERNMSKYYGLNRNFSLPLGFYKDAAFILRDAFFTTNIERKVFLLIQQLGLEYTDDYYKYLYSYLYKGELDFSTFKADLDKVTINIMEGGLSKQLKANENTVYEIPFDEDAKDLIATGIDFDQSASFIMPDIELTGTQYIMPISLISTDVASSTVVAFFTSNYTPYFGGPTYNFEPSLSNFFYTPIDITIRIVGSIKVTSSGSYSFWIVGSSNTAINPLNYPSEPGLYYIEPAVAAGVHDFQIDLTLDIPAGERLFFYTTHPFATTDTYLLTDIEISYVYQHPATAIKFYQPIDVFKKLCIKIFGSDSYAMSELLELNSNLALTCGDAIRGLEGATIKTSLSEFFEDYNVTCFAGLSIENGLIKIEDRATFFDTSDPIDLGNIKNHEISYASDLVGNVIKVGHTKPDIEDINGKFDPNGSSVFTTPITRVAKEINIVGPYKKGPYEIEITRINLDGKATTDNNNDNDCFVLDVKPVTETYEAVAGTFDGVDTIVLTGLASALSVFNGAKGFYLNDGTTQYLFLFELAIVNGSDLEITVNNPDLALPVTFSNYSISFPYILDRTAVVDSAAEVCPSPETIFNVRLTPKNILLKHGRWIRSLMWGFDSGKIKFQSGDKNTKFKAVVNGVTIDEDKDENINSLGDRLFYPLYHDIETLVPIGLVELMEENPNRCFRFTDVETEIEYTGFNIKAGLAPNTEQPQQFKLLSSPLNDLSTLIY